ncbi:deoxyhypusine synthase [Candidatus Woesearchaeota archaeon]|nr:deoxyhypusine synthase [Candidatus Woesearchaeota archaeon]
MKKSIDVSKKNILKESEDIKGINIKGFDFSKEFNMEKFLDSYETTGFQATNLKRAIEIIKKMRRDKATIYLAYTSNIVTSGLREVIAYLAKNKLVDVLITTGGGVEEDIVKTIKPFILGDFRLDGKKLRENGINRTGNILIPNNRYVEFEKLMIPFYKKLYDKQVKDNKIFSVSELVYELGKEVKDENSIYYWATKNNIPVFCPTFTDGSAGDMLYYFKNMYPEFKIDMSDDIPKLIEIGMTSKKTGVICLGTSVVKHHAINASLHRGGADYTVYVTTQEEFDGSDAGAEPDEGVSWGKIESNNNTVKVHGDATIIFPLIVTGAFKD